MEAQSESFTFDSNLHPWYNLDSRVLPLIELVQGRWVVT